MVKVRIEVEYPIHRFHPGIPNPGFNHQYTVSITLAGESELDELTKARLPATNVEQPESGAPTGGKRDIIMQMRTMQMRTMQMRPLQLQTLLYFNIATS